MIAQGSLKNVRVQLGLGCNEQKKGALTARPQGQAAPAEEGQCRRDGPELVGAGGGGGCVPAQGARRGRGSRVQPRVGAPVGGSGCMFLSHIHVSPPSPSSLSEMNKNICSGEDFSQ